MSDEKSPVPAVSPTSEIEAFVAKAKLLATRKAAGRLVLALDATMSRQPTWDLACELQADMFDAAAGSGRLDIQLVYFRGLGECRASRFVGAAGELKALMSRIDCRAGQTQIGKVLDHAVRENARGRVHAVVYVGDAMEEDVDRLAVTAGELGLRGVPVFVFQEGSDGVAERAFREIARLTRGAWFRFDRNAARTLSRLLSAIAVYAAGGLKALEARGSDEDRLLLAHLRGGGQGGRP